MGLMKISKDIRSQIFEHLRAFVVCPWWARIWVVQEITVNDTVVIRYGNLMTSWQVFVQAANTWSMPQTRELAHRATLEAENIKVMDLFESQVAGLERTRRRWRAAGGTSFARLLQEFSHRKASDDRDKVYGLLSLTKQEQQAFIDLDYCGSVLDTYRDTALALLKAETSLGCWTGDQRRKNHRELPSWIPDWSTTFDVGDRRRMDRVSSYKGNRWLTLDLADTEVSYWSAVSAKIERLLVSLAGRSGRLPRSLRPFLRQYLATLEQLKEWFTPTVHIFLADDPKHEGLRYLNLCRKHVSLSPSDQKALAQCIRLLQSGSGSIIFAITVKIKEEHISFSIESRTWNSNGRLIPKNFMVGYREDERLVEEWLDEHIMRKDLGIRRTAIRKLISQCRRLSELCSKFSSITGHSRPCGSILRVHYTTLLVLINKSDESLHVVMYFIF